MDKAMFKSLLLRAHDQKPRIRRAVRQHYYRTRLILEKATSAARACILLYVYIHQV